MRSLSASAAAVATRVSQSTDRKSPTQKTTGPIEGVTWFQANPSDLTISVAGAGTEKEPVAESSDELAVHPMELRYRVKGLGFSSTSPPLSSWQALELRKCLLLSQVMNVPPIPSKLWGDPPHLATALNLVWNLALHAIARCDPSYRISMGRTAILLLQRLSCDLVCDSNASLLSGSSIEPKSQPF